MILLKVAGKALLVILTAVALYLGVSYGESAETMFNATLL
jgi:hypothetical protein